MFADRPLLRAFAPPIIAFAAVTVAGILGFMYLGDIGPIEAAFWLIDTTSIELHGADDTVKAFAIVVIVGLVVTGLWIGETVLSAAFGGQISEELKQMTLENRIEELDGHLIVCGYGMFGRTIANGSATDETAVVVIESDEQTHRRVVDDGYLGIHGDARTEAVLRKAGIDRAGALVAAVDDTNVNVQIAIMTGELADDIHLVVRIGDEMYTDLAERAGADVVVIPEVLSGDDVVREYL